MENLENKVELKDKIFNFYKNNKVKILVFIFTLITILISTILIKFNNEQKNIIISEKYIKAGLYLATSKKEDAKLIYEEIILSKNKFYSILALNTLIEKSLFSDENKILEYFDILEKSVSSEEKKDLIIFKKALFLIKNSEAEKGKSLMQNLIDKNSSLKSVAKDIIEE